MNRLPRLPRRAAWATTLLLVACASEDLRPDYASARALIASTTGQVDVYDPDQPPLEQGDIDALLAEGLTLDESLRLALLNNRSLQAGFMGLGVARADFVQSGLLRNPTLGLALAFPAGSGRTRVTGSLAQDVMDLWRMPARRRVAEATMEQQVLALASQAGALVADTRAAYFEAVAARAVRSGASAAADLAARGLDASRQRRDQGVATETEVRQLEVTALRAELEASRAGRREVFAVRRLAGLLSLTRDLDGAALVDGLPDPHLGLDDRESLVARGVAARLDLRALREALRRAEQEIALARAQGLPDVSAGLGFERPESDDPTDHVLGPSLSVELPLFDGGEAQISGAQYERDRLLRSLEALEAEVRQQVRAAADAARLAVEASQIIEQSMLPGAERAADLARRAFEFGDTTLQPLLEAELLAVQARTAAVDGALDAALAMVELERALGVPLAAAVAGP